MAWACPSDSVCCEWECCVKPQNENKVPTFRFESHKDQRSKINDHNSRKANRPATARAGCSSSFSSSLLVSRWCRACGGWCVGCGRSADVSHRAAGTCTTQIFLFSTAATARAHRKSTPNKKMMVRLFYYLLRLEMTGQDYGILKNDTDSDELF